MFSVPLYYTFSSRCCRNVTVVIRRCGSIRSVLTARSCDLMVRTTGLAEDHGMNRRFRPLTCFLTLAMLAVLSSDAIALARHKQVQQASKADPATRAGHQRPSAFKKGRHPVNVAAAARRKPARSIDGPPQSAAAPPLSGDLAAVRQAIDLGATAKT